MPKFGHYFFIICVGCAIIGEAANNVRFPVAYRGTKGWIGLEQSSNESSLAFDFSSLATNATEIAWAILDTPFVYGDETCDDLVRRRLASGSLTSGALKVSDHAAGASWRGSATLKMSVSSLQARSILLTQGTAKNRQAVVCANILSDDVLVFESRFYGPQIVGDVYFFLDTTTKTLKLYSRLSNGNNFEPAVNWTLKNKWWTANFDYREPVWQSCRESGDKADSRYDPPPDLASLKPETAQLLEIRDWQSDSGGGASSAKDDLQASVLVLKSQQAKSWERYNVFGCARIRLSDGWSARAEAKVKNGSGMTQLVSFKQDTLFHPLRVRFGLPQQQTTISKPAAEQVRKDANNGSLSTSFFVSSNSTRKSVNIAPTSPPTFSLHQRTLSSDKDADCSRVGERLNLLSPDNSLRVESDQADEDNAAYSAYFTDAALESAVNNVLMKTILVRWPNKDKTDACATILPTRERTIFVQSSFYYPFAGAVAFAQPKNRPESITVVTGDLHHLFDDKPTTNANWSIVVRNVEPTLDDMSCAKERESYDPATMGTDLCRKSKTSCAIGELSDHIGPLNISGFDSAETGFYFSYASRVMPLGGPYSIVGQTLKVDAGWAKGCANVTYASTSAVADDQSCANHGGFSDHLHRAAVATFSGRGGINGTLFMYQSIQPENDALPSATTSICNNLQVSNDVKLSNLLFEILEVSNGTADVNTICRNNTATVFNPFFVDTTKNGYATVCSKSPSQCAIGDLTSRFRNIPTQQCSCVSSLPVAGPFGGDAVTGQLLRIRRADTKQVLACASFSSWEVGSVDMYMPEGITERQIAGSVSEEFHLDDRRVEVSSTKNESAAPQFKGCVLYEVSVFDPASSSIVDTLTKYAENKQSSWSTKWGSNKCVSAAAVVRFPIISAVFSTVVIFVTRTLAPRV